MVDDACWEVKAAMGFVAGVKYPGCVGSMAFSTSTAGLQKFYKARLETPCHHRRVSFMVHGSPRPPDRV